MMRRLSNADCGLWDAESEMLQDREIRGWGDRETTRMMGRRGDRVRGRKTNAKCGLRLPVGRDF
jgi:hypothetical protein